MRKTKRVDKEYADNALILSKENEAKGLFTVINDRGLHTRPSTALVKCASSFKAQVYLIYETSTETSTVNAKSLLGILTLAAARGARILVEAIGEDAELAVRSILELAKNKFHIQY